MACLWFPTPHQRHSGRALLAREPESIITDRGYGFRARGLTPAPRNDGVASSPRRASSIRARRAQFPDFCIGRHHRSAIDIFEVDHGALAVLERDLADEATHSRQMIDAAIDERAERAVDFQIFEGCDQFFGVGRL